MSANVEAEVSRCGPQRTGFGAKLELEAASESREATGEIVNFMKIRIVTWYVGYQQISDYKIIFIKKFIFNEIPTKPKGSG